MTKMKSCINDPKAMEVKTAGADSAKPRKVAPAKDVVIANMVARMQTGRPLVEIEDYS